MGAMRERKDVLWMLAGRWPGGQWRGRTLFTRRWWEHGRENIWGDTVGRHWGRLIVCRLFGHQLVFVDSDNGEPAKKFCKRCQMWGGNG